MSARILVVDDEAPMRLGLKEVLGRAGYTVETAEDGAQAIARLDRGGLDVVITDLRMPGKDGMDVLRHATAHHPGLLVYMITAHGDVPTAVAAVKRGAFDFVEKPFSNNALVDRIEQALALAAAELARQRDRRQRSRRVAELTERETEVMRLVIAGHPNKRIADELGISVRTVEVHRARIFDKMEVKSAVELANRLRDD